MRALSNHLLSFILCTPLAGASAVLVVGSRRPGAIRAIASVCAAAMSCLALPLWFQYEPHGKTWQFAERGPSVPTIGTSYYVGVDGFSILLILLTTLVGLIAILASWNQIRDGVREFYAALLILQMGILGVVMSLDFLLFFLFWEVTLVATYYLIRTWGGGRGHRSASTFVLHALGGSVSILGGILALYSSNHAVTGAYSFDITGLHTISVPADVQMWIFCAFFVGFASNIPLFPLHTWLPDAQTDAPTAGSVILAAVFLKLGTYGVLRFSLPILPDATRYFVPMMAALAVGGIVYGAVLALAQSDWKRVIAYASVSHMGIIALGIFALTPDGITGSFVQQVSHGISMAALLVMMGMVEERAQTRDISGFGGMGKTMPVFAALFLVMSMSVIGVPPLSGFVGDKLILQGLYPVNKLWAGAAAIGMVLGAVYMLRLYRRTVLGAAKYPSTAPLRDLTAREIAILAPLVALAVWIGLHPAPLVSRLETSMGRVVARVNPAYAPYVVQGSDCATPAPPEPSGPPPGFLLTESCADGSSGGQKPAGPER